MTRLSPVITSFIVPLFLTACNSSEEDTGLKETTRLNAVALSDFNLSCEVDSDCVIVSDQVCMKVHSSVHSSEKERYEAEWAEYLAELEAEGMASGCTQEFSILYLKQAYTPTCIANKCQAVFDYQDIPTGYLEDGGPYCPWEIPTTETLSEGQRNCCVRGFADNGETTCLESRVINFL